MESDTYVTIICRENVIKNIPILPEAFLTFASKSSVGPSCVANGQEDHKTYKNLNEDTVIMTDYCYFESIAQCMGLCHERPYQTDADMFQISKRHEELETTKLKKTPPTGGA